MTEVRVPDTLEEALSPEWLSSALGERWPGLQVTGVVPGPMTERITTNATFRIECAGELPEDLSADLCIKGYFNDLGRAYRPISEPEARFYQIVAPELGVRTLHAVYAGFDEESRHGVVLSDDVTATGGRFLDPRSQYEPDDVASSLEQLARLHAATWGGSRYREAEWLAPRWDILLAARGVTEIQMNLDGPGGVVLPGPVRDAERLYRAYSNLVAREGTLPDWCVVHGDAHVGNLILDGDGRPGLVDWQLVQRGSWYMDVGYHIASALPVTSRRDSEDQLLRHYLDALRAEGGPALDPGAAQRLMADGMLHGFYLWGITTEVLPETTATLVERLGTAVADHGVMAA